MRQIMKFFYDLNFYVEIFVFNLCGKRQFSFFIDFFKGGGIIRNDGKLSNIQQVYVENRVEVFYYNFLVLYCNFY